MVSHPTGLGEYTTTELAIEIGSRKDATICGKPLGEAISMLQSNVFTQQQVEQMMNELVGEDAYIDYSQKDLYGKGQLEGLEYLNSEKGLARQLIPSIIKKYEGR